MSVPRPDPWAWRELLRERIQLVAPPVEVPLAEAAGRLLAAEVRSPEDVPPLAISAMDGFAVRRSELTAPGASVLPVSGEHPARPGGATQLPVGHALRIMTGAPVPLGADAVIPVEDTDADPFGPLPDRVTVHSSAPVPPLRHIRTPGEEIARGEVLAGPVDRVGAGLIGLAATLGLSELPVAERLRVGVVVTGDELLDGGAPGAPGNAASADGAIRESNGTMLAAALAAEGVCARVRCSSDDPADLLRVLEETADCDLVITTGGIGHGAYDVVKSALGPRGSRTSHFEHLALRPGGPQGYGQLPGGTPVVHLPGTPVGALIGYHLFVRPLLPGTDATPVPARLGRLAEDGAPRRARPGLLAQPGRLRHGPDGSAVVDLLPGTRLAPYGRADAIVLREAATGADGPGRHPGGPDEEDIAMIIAL